MPKLCNFLNDFQNVCSSFFDVLWRISKSKQKFKVFRWSFFDFSIENSKIPLVFSWSHIINIVSVKTMEVSDENCTNLSRNNLTNEGSGTFTFQLFSLLLANSNIKISFLQIICRMKQYKWLGFINCWCLWPLLTPLEIQSMSVMNFTK